MLLRIAGQKSGPMTATSEPESMQDVFAGQFVLSKIKASEHIVCHLELERFGKKFPKRNLRDHRGGAHKTRQYLGDHEETKCFLVYQNPRPVFC